MIYGQATVMGDANRNSIESKQLKAEDGTAGGGGFDSVRGGGGRVKRRLCSKRKEKKKKRRLSCQNPFMSMKDLGLKTRAAAAGSPHS